MKGFYAGLPFKRTGLYIVLGITGCILAAPQPAAAKVVAQRACPMLARLCPDGVHTSTASGPNCEFTPCPGEEAKGTGGAAPQPMPPATPAPPPVTGNDDGNSGDDTATPPADVGPGLQTGNGDDGSSGDMPPEDYPGDNGANGQTAPVMPKPAQ